MHAIKQLVKVQYVYSHINLTPNFSQIRAIANLFKPLITDISNDILIAARFIYSTTRLSRSAPHTVFHLVRWRQRNQMPRKPLSQNYVL